MTPDAGRPKGLLRIFRAVLRLYPEPFRRRFADSMEEAFSDRLADARPGARRLWTAARALAEVAVAGVMERLRPAYRPPASDLRPRRGLFMDHLAQDVRFAVRSLTRRPLFTLVAVGTLALGIGATAAVFSIVNGVLLRPLPYPEPDGLVMLWSHDRSDPAARGWMSLPNLEDLGAAPALEHLEGWQGGAFTLTDGDRPERVGGARVTGGLLEVFGLTPLMGRDLRRSENAPGTPRVVVLSHRLWRERFGSDPEIVGRTVNLNETAYEVVGVAPPGFDFPDGASLWTPYRHDLGGCGRRCTVYRAVGRLAPGVDRVGLDAELATLAERLTAAYPDANRDVGFHTESLLDYQVRGVRSGLWVVMGAVALVLLIVCANLANLVFARASSRMSEVGVRSALGASRGRLVRQILTESGLLAAVGGALGVGLAVVMVQIFTAVAPMTLPRVDGAELDVRVLAFALAATTAAALLSGLAPALHLANTPPGVLVGGQRGGSDRGDRSRAALMAGEIGLSFVLLVASGLLLRSLDRLYDVDLGFTEREVVRFSVSLPRARYDTLPELAAFYEALEERLVALPGAVSAGSAFGVPLGGGNLGGGVRVEGRPEPAPGAERYTTVRPVTPGYFATLGIPILRGRGVEAGDRTGTEPVTVVNQRFVEENFPDGRDPLGQRIRVGAGFGWDQGTFMTIVGVVGDTRRSLRASVRPAVYPPHSQFGPESLRVHVRARNDADALVAAIPDVVRELDPALAVTGVGTLDDAVRADAAPTRFYLLLVMAFAAVAVLLTAVGLYGLVAFVVGRRTREIGIRLALGAGRPSITTMMLRQGLAPAVLGVTVGVAVALVSGRVMESLLFEVEPADPLVLAAVTALVLLVSAAAALVPARRATRVDPTEALRAE